LDFHARAGQRVGFPKSLYYLIPPEVPLKGEEIMSRICEVTGKRRQKGNQVSHAMNHTRKFFQVNLQKKRFWVPSEKKWVTLRVSSSGVRFIAKNGIDAALSQMQRLQIERA
jgi:large subunit ribosomal protein L28